MIEYIGYSQPAYILSQSNYSESSLIIEALTQDFGRVALIAKGVRKAKSKHLGALQPFAKLSLSFVGKTEFKTLTDVERLGPAIELDGLAFYCGFYVNELICKFLHKYDPHPEVFQDYHDCLPKLADEAQRQAALRIFELNLLGNIGYGVRLDYDLQNGKAIVADKSYRFNTGDGLVEDTQGQFSGLALLAIQQRQFHDPWVLNEAKRLTRTLIDSHLDGRQLKSRAVIKDIIKRM